MSIFQLERLGTIMAPEPGNPREIEGVLNPAVIRGPDGELYIFPRLVAKGNYSCIGIAKVIFNESSDPIAVQRLGIVLEPEMPYEKRPDGGGGCEDPRITYVEPLETYVMTYCAFGPDGPRIAMASSRDLFKWDRLGLISYRPYKHIDFNNVNNKDACLFPIDVLSPHDHLSIAMLHRPLFPGTRPEEIAEKAVGKKDNRNKEEIWISYCNLTYKTAQSYKEAIFTSHRKLAIPISTWEKLKIGAGAPPVLTRHGWLLVYHGVQQIGTDGTDRPHLSYAAGIMILAKDHPEQIVYRSLIPILSPELPEEKVGTISNVVFPTGVDCRHDIGQPERIDIYYGMADNKIGVAKLTIPETL